MNSTGSQSDPIGCFGRDRGIITDRRGWNINKRDEFFPGLFSRVRVESLTIGGVGGPGFELMRFHVFYYRRA